MATHGDVESLEHDGKCYAARAWGLGNELAKYILTLGFSTDEKTRYEELAYRGQDDNLSAEERQELEDFLNMNDFLTVAMAKARISLKHGSN
jgi:hypothetical protein